MGKRLREGERVDERARRRASEQAGSGASTDGHADVGRVLYLVVRLEWGWSSGGVRMARYVLRGMHGGCAWRSLDLASLGRMWPRRRRGHRTRQTAGERRREGCPGLPTCVPVGWDGGGDGLGGDCELDGELDGELGGCRKYGRLRMCTNGGTRLENKEGTFDEILVTFYNKTSHI